MTPKVVEQTETMVRPLLESVAPPKGGGLRERAARQRKRQNRLAVALIAVLVVGALAVYIPQRRAIAAMKMEVAQTESDVLVNQSRAAMLPQLKTTNASLRRQVDQYKPLRGRSDIERAMHEISGINTSTQLTNYKYDMDLEKQRPMCREQPLKITFQAEFVDAMSFIQKLEAMDRLTRLRELTIEKRDGAKSGAVNVSMSLSLFFDPADEGKK